MSDSLKKPKGTHFPDPVYFIVISTQRFIQKGHSYPVGIYSDFKLAVRNALVHDGYRGGKYKCLVHKSVVNHTDHDNVPEVMFDTSINQIYKDQVLALDFYDICGPASTFMSDEEKMLVYLQLTDHTQTIFHRRHSV